MSDFTLLWPVDAELEADNPFGANPELYAPLGYSGHPGIDFACPEGTPVRACADGTVVSAGPAGTAGNMVCLDHPDGQRSRYLHLSRWDVNAGDDVTRGQQIGLSGNTGYTEGPHLHLDYYPAGWRQNTGNGYASREDGAPLLVKEDAPADAPEPP